MGALKLVAVSAVSTVLSAGIGLAVTSGITATPTATAEVQTRCQWSYEAGRTVTIFGDNVQAWKVRTRNGTTAVDVANRKGRQWISVSFPKGTAEDDIRKVSAKIGGTWKECGTA